MKNLLVKLFLFSLFLVIWGCSVNSPEINDIDPNVAGITLNAEMDYTPDTQARYYLWWLQSNPICFASETLISTPEGESEIDFLKKGDLISSPIPGINFDIKETYSNVYDGTLYRLTAGENSIIVSEIHPIIIFDGEKVTVKAVNSIDSSAWVYTENGWVHPTIEPVEYSGSVYNFFLWDPEYVTLNPEILKFRCFFAEGIASADLTTQIALEQ